MDDTLLIRVLARLVQVRVQLGDKCYEDAVHGALTAIARSAIREAERRAGLPEPYGVNVIPLGSRRLEHGAETDRPS
ncbi:hypothetical protein [Devosia submarina]|uniref:hypothetical protein n=1 Tax=Devosia submarina TaxID=1173082 RepID=UPI0013004007|nr:hypothetical protein [Devosia submarina]